MLATNIVLLIALVAMIAGAVWLFRDGEGPGPKAPVRLRDKDADPEVTRVRIADADAESDERGSDRG
ncbi:MAG: hypothetical protein K9M02_16340 [Thiohalocapsa sp.]|nr:hypothetical protein [Thiohalocapsa sp.]